MSGAEARERCLELSWRAAFDPGLIAALVAAQGSYEAVLATGVTRRPGARRRASLPPAPRPRRLPAGAEVVTWVDDDYPQRLRQLSDPPPALFVRGRCELLRVLDDLPLVAVVGARGPSAYGREMAALLGGELARSGVGVVSGLALGIDAAAHQAVVAALEVDPSGSAAPPVAVLGCGVDLIHPRSNARLFARVAAGGLIVSEYWHDLPGLAWRFPARNRIIAALAEAVVVVEGAATSGARHTAGFAADLGREVLAVPGEAGRRLAALPHRLLRDGAHLCESAADVIAALPSRPPATCRGPGAASDWPVWHEGGDGTATEVLGALRDGDRSLDELLECCGAPVTEVMAAVGRLEIAGLVENGSAGSLRAVRRPQP